ncbi:MAG: hypothetical protein IKL52_01595 [Candidatus Gastranaerophilales bacterium]|nr:hypothetical protein [Candidatus Gastranaerophilales bacterium]
MIEALNLTTYKKNYAISSRAEKFSTFKNQNGYNLPDFKTGLALKNQILFKGNLDIKQKRELIQNTIEQKSLPIKPQTLDFVLVSANSKSPLAVKYNKTGSKFFELFSRYLLHKKYPIKDEGELTDIIAQFIKSKNKARILGDILPSELLPKGSDKNSAQTIQANSLNLLLGAMIYENENGFKTAFEFLDNALGENIFPKNLKLEKSAFEHLADTIERYGKSWNDLYQETRFFNEQWHYRIHYKDIILSEANGGKHNHELREQCADEAIIRITSGEINLDDAGDDLTYTNYKVPDKKRAQELKDFAQKWGIEIKDISLLHKAFLYGEMQDCSALAHCDTYETLEYIGDAVLGFCTHEILQDNLPNLSRQKICAKRHAFVKNKNLSLMADKMKLMDYTINRNQARGEKRSADLFEALIGAIFMDGGADGVDKVYKFLDDNFRDEIINI